MNLLEDWVMVDIYRGYGVKYTISPAPFLEPSNPDAVKEPVSVERRW